MRICIVLPSLYGGGAEFVAATWARELAIRGHEVCIALTMGREDEKAVPGVRVVTVTNDGAGRLAEYLALGKFLSRNHFDVTLSMMTRANFQLILLARLLRIPGKVVISERNIPYTESSQSRLHEVIRNSLYRFLYRQADAFLAISHSVAASFMARTDMDRRKFWVVPNPALGKSGVLLRPRVTSDDQITLVVPARLVEAKRPQLAYDVAREVSKQMPVQLLFFGEGPYRVEVPESCDRVSVRYMGRVENWFDHLPVNSIVLLTSVVEGFGNVLIEAASRGVPSVACSITLGVSDAIIPGQTGYFARSDSAVEYARAVLKAQQLEVKNSDGWLREFSVGNSVNELERLFAAE